MRHRRVIEFLHNAMQPINRPQISFVTIVRRGPKNNIPQRLLIEFFQQSRSTTDVCSPQPIQVMATNSTKECGPMNALCVRHNSHRHASHDRFNRANTNIKRRVPSVIRLPHSRALQSIRSTMSTACCRTSAKGHTRPLRTTPDDRSSRAVCGVREFFTDCSFCPQLSIEESGREPDASAVNQSGCGNIMDSEAE